MRQQGVQQHVGAGGCPGGGDVFPLVVADAVHAGNENHGGWGDAVKVTGIVAGAGNHVAMAVAQRLRGMTYAVDAAPIKSDRGILENALGASGQAAAVDVVYRRQQALLHLFQN